MSSRLFALAQRLAGIAFLVVLGCSVTLNVVQANRLRGPAEVPGLQAGEQAPPIDVHGLDGRQVTLKFSGQPTILYYFSPNCGWCERNWLNVKALMAETDGHYRFVGLSASPDVKAYLQDHRVFMETYTNLSLEDARKLGFGATPHTMVLSADGRVQYTWAGVYSTKLQSRIERAFGIVLPGITAPTPTRSSTEVSTTESRH